MRRERSGSGTTRTGPPRRKDAAARPIRRPTTNSQPRSAETRGLIIDAALQAFATHGYAGASTRAIAAAAGVNQGLIAYHFGGKEALWKAAVGSLFTEVESQVGAQLAALGGVDTATQVRAMIKHFVRFAAAHPELNQLMVQEGKHDGPRMKWIVDECARPLYDFSTALIRRAQAAGLMPKFDPLHLHYIFIGAATLIFAMAPEVRRLSKKDPRRAEFVEAHAEALERILLDSTVATAPQASSPTRKFTKGKEARA